MPTLNLLDEYQAYIKKCIRNGETILNPSQWELMVIAELEASKPKRGRPRKIQVEESVVEVSPERQKQINHAFKALMVPEGFGSLMERVLWDIKKI